MTITISVLAISYVLNEGKKVIRCHLAAEAQQKDWQTTATILFLFVIINWHCLRVSRKACQMKALLVARFLMNLSLSYLEMVQLLDRFVHIQEDSKVKPWKMFQVSVVLMLLMRPKTGERL